MISKRLIPISFIALVIGFWNRDDLSGEMLVATELSQEPMQRKIKRPAFDVEAEQIDYRIEPLYDYVLHGMVVSYRHHNSKYGLHKYWNDHLNVADLCVIWGDNVHEMPLSQFDFWNGQFTCNISTSSRSAWQKFNMNQLSNNHLITVDDHLRDQLADVRIGDQIRVEGWLSNYSNDRGGSRGTSTIRTDTGNGACETVYVNDVEIISRYNSDWRKLMYLSLVVFLLSLFWYLKTPYRIQP